MVIEKDIAFVKPTGDAKGVRLAINFSGLNHPRLGQGSECHRNKRLVGRSVSVVYYVRPRERLRLAIGSLKDTVRGTLVVKLRKREMEREKGSSWCLSILVLFLMLSGCASIYFRDAGEPPAPPPQYTLTEWPYCEYWTGVVFNGDKIGFTHLTLTPAEDTVDRFDIRSEASLRFRFLMLDKRVVLKSYDRVAGDLSLESFAYDYDLDGSRLKMSGRMASGRLEIDIFTQGQSTRQTIPVEGKLYPTSIIGLYPVSHGLDLGRRYTYQVYDGENQTVGTVTQEILAYEESDLFPGKAFKIKTRLHNQEVTTWVDEEGKPLLEMALGGVLISGLEDEDMAKKYLAQAAINKEETLLGFSLIRSNIVIPEPERVTFMEVALYGIDDAFSMPADGLQRCERQGEEVICEISAHRLEEVHEPHTADLATAESYLRPSFTVPSQNTLIRRMAREITVDKRIPHEQIRMLLEWIQENIDKKPVDVFTALDVLARRKAECQGHAFLYAAFARALEIPTRVVNGIVYSGDLEGFLYHTWAESLVNGRWVPVDPTFSQLPADATHIKLIEGERFCDLLPLGELIGRLQIRIVTAEGF